MNFRNIVFLMLTFGASSAWGMDDQIGRMKAFGNKKFIFEKNAQNFFGKKDIDLGTLNLNSEQCYYPLKNEKGYVTFKKGVNDHIFVDYIEPFSTVKSDNVTQDIYRENIIKTLNDHIDYEELKGFYVKRIKKVAFEFRPKYKFFQCYINNNDNEFKKDRFYRSNPKIKNQDSELNPSEEKIDELTRMLMNERLERERSVEDRIFQREALQRDDRKDKDKGELKKKLVAMVKDVVTEKIDFDVVTQEVKKGQRNNKIQVTWDNIDEESQIKLEEIGIVESVFNKKNIECDKTFSETPMFVLRDKKGTTYTLMFVQQNYWEHDGTPWFFRLTGEKNKI